MQICSQIDRCDDALADAGQHQNVLTHTHPHSIVLEHDGGGDRRNTVAALRIFIPELLERGYHFVAI